MNTSLFKDSTTVSLGKDISSSYLLFATRVLASQHCFQRKQTRLIISAFSHRDELFKNPQNINISALCLLFSDVIIQPNAHLFQYLQLYVKL